MMENYDEIRLSSNITVNAKDLIDEVGDGNTKLTNFDFGAEILTTTTSKSEAEATANKTKTVEEEEAAIQMCAKQKIQTVVPNTEEEEDEDEDASVSSECDDDDDDDDDEEEGEDDSNSSSDCSSIMGGGANGMDGGGGGSSTDFKLRWLQREFYTGRVPRQVIASIMPHFATTSSDLPDDSVLWDYLAHLLNEPKRRSKLQHVNTFDDVIDLLQKSQRIIVLTGAGVSVSCGIPDFRSTNGIYARLAHDFPDLPDPQAMFDINYFKRDPRPFYKFAREIYPGEFKPSPCHRFIKMLETKGKLLRNYTQNIDTLEQVAGIQRVIECHGSFSTASCTKCKYKCNADALRKDIFAQRIPVCPQCQPHKEQSVDASVAVTEDELKQLVENGIMKPDIVFFGEGLPDEYHTVMATDKDKCDLLIVIGSSLKVRPVAHIPSSIPGSVPQILINREQLHHLKFDVELLGDSDVIINQICHRLSSSGEDPTWQQLCCNDMILQESKELMPPEPHYQHRHHYHPHQYAQQVLLDSTDTQSLKSNGSAAGTCSDSGFESSSADRAAIERIKSDILVELNEAPTGLSTGPSYRHLSIDSSKDSGIEQCEQDPRMVNRNLVQETKTAAPSLTPIQPQRIKRQTAGERLQSGTFYCHSNNYSYVFPGAQVSWDDYSDDDDDDGGRIGHDIFSHDVDDDDGEDGFDLNATPLSPLLPPSLEAHIVTEIASGGGGLSAGGSSTLDICPLVPTDTADSNCSSPSQKRLAVASNSNGDDDDEVTPLKRRRPSQEAEHKLEESPPPASAALAI
ncbi:uncharacterized protein Dwil_GK15314 [Drosophila willistoni]|uniref:protein acetyllysine N-acetyltransferase n=1 Tax=Drosophila willistoni TaxID=7260 RepID=B4MUH5_DROWI|nr:NAD-dependent histone deacetylase sirtuin-1 [Drosophila willistoni]EDW76170.1 uncharacterized protein Dwil_GK15314 [Drosophila willistoni]